MSDQMKQRGFSLIELVMVIMILGIAGAAVLGQFASVGPGLLNSEAIQTAAQLAQERAEDIITTRRIDPTGYAAIPVGTINDTLTGNYASYSRTVTVTAYAGSACPVADCRQVNIAVDKGGSTLAEVDFMVANY